uniref:4-coumarate--CoA ligase n=1 Tax=Aegilops tauschii TaxID=37682 RepID=N1R4S7_AEGTA
MEKLPKRPANYVPLSPVGFLPRAAAVYGDRTSVVYGRLRFTWSHTYERCRRLAAALLSLGVRKNDVVSVLAPNVPAMYEMHFAVPMAAAVLNTVNTRLDAKAVAAILRHSQAKVLFVDNDYVSLANDALQVVADAGARVPLVAVIVDIDRPTGVRLGVGELEYEALVSGGDPASELPSLADEWDAVTLNYTSGTTSAPKGVVYSHRGAYLNTTSQLLSWGVGTEPVYLWTLPMFHCNGWTLIWGMAARGGARQGVSVLSLADANVVDDNTMASVPRDGKSVGEIALRGSSIMKGYLDNPEANDKAFKGGWFMTGDVGVVHPDGYIEVKDRSKDVIISGGENICSKEVEEVLLQHQAVADAAVVAMPHPHWGETPCAFLVASKKAAEVCEDEVIAFCREHMARFMAPRKVVVVDALPRNALGKVDKVKLRDAVRSLVLPTATSRL